MSEDMPSAVELILRASFCQVQDGGHIQFLFGRPGAPMWSMNLGAEVYFSRLGLLKASLLVRKIGPLYLRSLPIKEIESRLMNFVRDNYGYLAGSVWGQVFRESFSYRVSPEVRGQLASALQASALFSPAIYVTVFPLVPITVQEDFESEAFFLVKPTSLGPAHVGSSGDLRSEQFPPVPYWEGRVERPTAWLGVRAAAEQSAKRTRNVVLGALALLPHPRERHMFSGRSMFGGTASFNNGWTFSFGAPVTPALMEDLTVGSADLSWLALLSEKIGNSADSVRRQMKALEYFYRAWPLPEVERFPVLFMALDAVFGAASLHTQAVANAVGAEFGAEYNVARLKLLMKLRAAVIHGGAPDIYDNSSYIKYYETYEQDPIYDLELIVSRSLQSVVFEGRMTSREHTHAELIRTKYGRKL